MSTLKPRNVNTPLGDRIVNTLLYGQLLAILLVPIVGYTWGVPA